MDILLFFRERLERMELERRRERMIREDIKEKEVRPPKRKDDRHLFSGGI